MSVGLVIVSHSAKIAQGVLELASQMAPSVAIVAAGGTDEDGLGTSVAKIQSGIETANSGDGVVILTDLGSAVMSAEMVVELLAPEGAAKVRIADAPLVEGAVAAAVAAAGGQSIDEVSVAAEGAAGLMLAGRRAGSAPGSASMRGLNAPDTSPPEEVTGTWRLPNEMGLHARPAAEIAKKIQDLDVEAEINGVDAASVMLLMTLGLKKGQELVLRATGPDAQAAKDWLGTEIENGFGEL